MRIPLTLIVFAKQKQCAWTGTKFDIYNNVSITRTAFLPWISLFILLFLAIAETLKRNFICKVKSVASYFAGSATNKFLAGTSAEAALHLIIARNKNRGRALQLISTKRASTKPSYNAQNFCCNYKLVTPFLIYVNSQKRGGGGGELYNNVAHIVKVSCGLKWLKNDSEKYWNYYPTILQKKISVSIYSF